MQYCEIDPGLLFKAEIALVPIIKLHSCVQPIIDVIALSFNLIIKKPFTN